MIQYRNSSRFLAVLATAAISSHALAEAVPVEIVEQDGSWRLLRGGEPYQVHGAGLEFSDPAVFAAHGGNSFRTWRTDNEQFTGKELLDEAARNGLTVLLCIEIARERHGFDYNDEKAVAAQFEYARGEVMKYKDHPALLGWMIGNEPNLHAENPGVYDAINDISEMIHDLDGQHPTTTALAGFGQGLADITRQRMQDLDFISVQFYGDIVNLPRYMEEIGWDRPYMVTEWGAIGHWEVPKTEWGAPIEQNSSDKAANYHTSYEKAIAVDPDRIIGNYVFLWGQKQERTPTWYGMFLADGSKTETVDVMQKIWTGEWPDNRSPQVNSLTLNGQVAPDNVTLAAGSMNEASITAADPEDDSLSFRWEVMRESQATQTGGDREQIPEAIGGLFTDTDGARVSFRAPEEPGAYRLFVYVHDGQGSAGHANIPFRVERD
jgi:hypothetical protein